VKSEARENPMNLYIDSAHTLNITLRHLIGESVAVLGIKGSGKTNTAAVVIEELLLHNLPLTIVDIEGEYWGLKERFDVVVVGQSANVDIPITTAHAATFAEYSIAQGVSLVLDLSEMDPDEVQPFLLSYFNALWQAAFKARRPYQIILEEAHEFVPQGVRTPLKAILTRIALRGRKRGLGLITISQRSAKVEKDVLTQAAIVFLHKVVHPIDLKVYQDILPLPSKEVEGRVGQLTKGEALVLIDHQVHTALIRLRHTYHAGATPELDAANRVAIKGANDELLSELRRMVSEVPSPATGEESNLKRLEKRIVELEAALTSKDEEIDRLGERIALLSQLEVSMREGAIVNIATPITAIEEPQKAKEGTAIAPARPPEPNLPRGAKYREQATATRQESRFVALLRDVRQMRQWWRDLLVWLTHRDDTAYSVKQICKALHISESTMKAAPPLDLIEMGLLRRTGNISRNFTYQSTVRRRLADMFPALDTEELTQRLLRSL
jgi:hypothetical protein